jgi:hypothetical protein
MAECLRCRREFEPRKAGHVFCKPACRHGGPRREGEPEPPNEAMLAKLFDRKRASAGRVDADDWHPAGQGSPRAQLDFRDSIADRRRWYETLVEEGSL